MKEIRVGRPVIIGEVTIVPLERVSVYHGSRKGGLSLYISKEPIGVVISSAQGKQAFNMSGERVPLETYTQEIDELQQVLDSL